MNLSGKPFCLTQPQAQKLAETLQSLSLAQKVGQLFCVLGDLYDEATLEEMTAEGKIGGVLLRPDCLTTVKERLDKLSSLTKAPLLKAANLEEGGCGCYREGTYFASQMQLAATGDTETATWLGQVCAHEGRAAGINWTFSPVSDINFNFRNPITNTRTYGSDPETVYRMTLAYMQAVQEGGVAASAKHFPGDGVDERDHHLHVTVNSLSEARWWETYGKVYQTMIDAGLLTVMVGHIAQPACAKAAMPTIDPMLPASMSPALLNGLLRDRMGFQGLIVTDATIMGGYCQPMKRADALVASINAGCDMILFNTDFEEDYAAMLEAASTGIITSQRLDEAVTRILALKLKLDAVVPASQSLPIAQWKRDCARRSLTLIKDEQGLLPISSDRFSFVKLYLLGKKVCEDGALEQLLTKAFERRGVELRVFDADSEGMSGEKANDQGQLNLYVAYLLPQSDVTTVRIFWNAKFALDMPRFISAIPSVFVSFANPYHMQDVPAIPTFFNAYAASEETVEAFTAALFGEIIPVGKSPVRVEYDPMQNVY